jgi:aryl-alcohol dehydrogenase-like predicted oxidoreductase
VRFIGASNHTGGRLREALETSSRNQLPRYDVLQPLYNLLEREEYESDLKPVVEEFGLGVTPYYGLASGFLSGKYRTESDLRDRARASRVKKYLNPTGFAIVEELEFVAHQYGTSAAAVALAWLAQRPTITSAIASATSEQQLETLAAAAELSLDEQAMERLNDAQHKIADAVATTSEGRSR